MSHRIVLLLFLLIMQPFFAKAERFKYERDYNYQPMIINGSIVLDSNNASGGNWVIFDRYEAIYEIVKQLNQPIQMLDIGANNGFFSLKLAEEFPTSHFVMIDGTHRLADICMANTQRNNILYLQKYFSLSDIRNLSSREQFDVILCAHVLHHVDNWREWLNALKEMASYIIIETPSLEDKINKKPQTRQLAKHLLQSEDSELIARFPRGKNGPLDYMFLVKGNKQSSHTRIGISSETFFLFNGSFPNPHFVRSLQKEGKPFVLFGTSKK